MNKKDLKQLKKIKSDQETQKRILEPIAQQILKRSKRAIFALQRNDIVLANKLIQESDLDIKKVEKIIKKQPAINNNSVWKSAQEEYLEAFFFQSWLKDFHIDINKSVSSYAVDIILGALADTAGELARHCVLQATQHNLVFVEKAYQSTNQIVDFLADLDLTGNLRSKFDQAQRHLKKIESIRYDLSQR